jgi:NAD(P)-dependent dehydrogenase (short-subunit alcohol dehydrogenase family)
MSTALIWGAGGGIGQALTALLIAEGWEVAGITRQPSSIQRLTKHTFEADVSDDAAVQYAVFAAAQELAPVDMWVYSVGDIAAAKVADLDEAMWQRLLEANLGGAFRTIHHSLPLLAERAHLVFVGAYSERLQLPGLSAYAAAKAGLEAFTAALAKEQRGHRVTLVRPGAVATALWDKMPVRMPRDAMAPAVLARHILDAYHAGHAGRLDL